MNFVEQQISENFVSVSWVARRYKVSRMAVHRAIEAGKLDAARVAGPPRGHGVWILDKRLLPETWPD